MKKALKLIFQILLFVFLTVISQFGGVVYIISTVVCKKRNVRHPLLHFLAFTILYLFCTYLIVPITAPLFGREKVKNSKFIQPTNYMNVLFNRNYVRPEMNTLLEETAMDLKGTGITLHYLDACFPFINKFPLLPHLSHNDGRKLDLSLIYETKEGTITAKQLSRSGYGVFEEPRPEEHNQIRECLTMGYFQYNYPKYLTMGTINKELLFSSKGTKQLAEALLRQPQLEKMFIEPHLKSRLGLDNEKIRYHGCRAVRHDDHIHIQVR